MTKEQMINQIDEQIETCWYNMDSDFNGSDDDCSFWREELKRLYEVRTKVKQGKEIWE